MKRIINKISPSMLGYIIFDALAILFVTVLALLVRFEFDWHKIDVYYWNVVQSYYLINLIATIAVYIFFRVYHKLWKYAGTIELIQLVMAVICSVCIQYIGIHLVKKAMPRSYYVLYLLLMVAVAIISRFYRRIGASLKDLIFEKEDKSYSRVMIYGAGSAGQLILREIKDSGLVERKNVCCIIDDNPSKQGTYLMDVPVVGGRSMVRKAVEKYRIDEIIIAIPTLDTNERRQLVKLCSDTGCQVSILPGMYQLINENINFEKLRSSLRKVELEDLLGRDPIRIDLKEIMGYVSGRTVMVTGGGGSIGSELCRQIAAALPKQLIILDIYENNAYDLQMELRRTYPFLNLQVIIASVRDRDRIRNVFETYRPELVYHAAAHKHVPLMEDNPWESVKNNVMGTDIVAGESDRIGVEKFVMISTDKAVRPTNIMGATKRICEMIVQNYSRKSKTEYVAVRFGNVLGSNGSVVPLFKKQIEEGGPVTVTHPDIIRYFMTIPEAVSLVLQAGAYAKGGEIFILDMGEPVKILDMAENLIRLSGYTPGVDMEIKFTGLRPGEKLYEELLMEEEKTETQNERIFIGQQIPVDDDYLNAHLKRLYVAAYNNDSELRNIVQELVPEYHIPESIDSFGKEERNAIRAKQA